MNGKKMIWLATVVVAAMLMTGCAAEVNRKPVSFPVQPLAMQHWRQKTHNLVVVLDASSSMLESYEGVEKFAIGRNFLQKFNETIPDLPLQVALRSFGHSKAFSEKPTVLDYGLSEYSRSGFAEALGAIVPAGGPSPMTEALQAVADDLANSEGTIALLLVSDGKDIENSALAAAKALKTRFGDRLCIYTVLVGYEAEGRALLSAICNLSGCGRAVNARDIQTGETMAGFVADVLLKKGESAALPEMSKAGTWVFKDIKFEVDKAVLMESSYPRLNEIVKILKEHPGLRVEIQGHTDSTASDAYNLNLSQRRAQTVRNYLQGRGIAASRLTAVGYGESRPIDTNETERGRSNNRRVELKPLP